MTRALAVIGASLMISGGLALIGFGWRARRRSQGWLPVWGGAMAVAWGIFSLAPETALAIRYVAGAVGAAFLLAMFVSTKGQLFRSFVLELFLAAVATGAIAALELFAPAPRLANVLLAILLIVMTAFVVAISLRLVKVLRTLQKSSR